jgi:hypothetical protein
MTKSFQMGLQRKKTKNLLYRWPVSGGGTLGATAVYFQTVIGHDEAMLMCNLFLQFLDTRILELDNFTAFNADEMIMMIAAVSDFVKGLTAAKVTLFGKATFRQQLERPVNCRIADMGMLFSNPVIKFLGRQMGGSTEKFIQNDFPLTRKLESLLADIISEHLAFVGHGTSDEIEYQITRGNRRMSRCNRGRRHLSQITRQPAAIDKKWRSNS